jgi:hypothetical protein
MERRLAGFLTAMLLATAVACGTPGSDGAVARTSPTSPDATSALAGAPGGAGGAAAGGLSIGTGGEGATACGLGLPADDGLTIGSQAVDFPPRNEPFDFRANALEARYRDVLRRPAVSSFVDVEGTIVWTQEYLRYRVNRCGHQEAIQKVFDQIDGRGLQPVCGNAPTGNVAFPPRNEPFEFRTLLEAKYRDGLRRPAGQTFVDAEGDVIWTQEYLRYRVSSCSHTVAVDKVMTQIGGAGVAPDCSATGPPPTTPTGPAQLRASFTVTGPSGNNRCLATSNQEADCTFDASASTGGPAGLSYAWEYRTNQSSDRSEFGVRIRPLLGCGFSTGVQTFAVTVTLVITDRADNNNRATATQTVQGIRVPGNCGFNP